MENKGIAINTILLLVVGTITVAAIIYLVYSVTTTPTLSVQQCKTKIMQYCTLCANIDWGDGEFDIKTPQELRDCGNNYPELSVWADNYCCDDSLYNPGDPDAFPPIPPSGCGVTRTDCRALGTG